MLPVYICCVIIMCTAKGRPIIICDKDDVEMEKKAFHCLKVLYTHTGHIIMY